MAASQLLRKRSSRIVFARPISFGTGACRERVEAIRRHGTFRGPARPGPRPSRLRARANARPASGESSNQPVYHPCPADPSCRHRNGAPAAEDGLGWSFLDAAYCISLKPREDRAAQAAAEFHRVGLCRHVTFYRPDKHPRNGFIGSWMSHRDVALLSPAFFLAARMTSRSALAQKGSSEAVD